MPISDPSDVTANLDSGGGNYVPPLSSGTTRSAERSRDEGSQEERARTGQEEGKQKGAEQSCRSAGKNSKPDKDSVQPNPTNQPPSGSERYRSGVELGRGGWGHVELARDKQLDRDVAVKRINRELVSATSIHDRFFQEALVTGQLQHPGIVPVHELGVDEEGAPFYVMKLLEGSTFKEKIKEIHRDPNHLASGFSPELLDRFNDVGNAIAYAHKRGVIHRDLKPSNIMVGQFGETIVVDWGLAKQLVDSNEVGPNKDLEKTMPQGAFFGTSARSVSPHEANKGEPLNDDATLASTGPSVGLNHGASSKPASSGPQPQATPFNATPSKCIASNGLPSSKKGGASAGPMTRSGAVLGTPAYMSPEQSEGENHALSPATDIYALGVILYEVLTGKNPFRAKDIETTLTRVRAGEYEPPRAINPRVPRALAAICTTAMSRCPEDRYEKAEQMVADIQCFLAGESVSVYEEPWWTKVIRWYRRRPALTAGVMGSVIVLTFASIIFGAIVHRAHQAELRARLAAEASRQEALSHLGEAREAADAWLIELSGSLQFFPGMEGLRGQLLEEAIVHYQQLASKLVQNADQTLDSSLERAKCDLRLGDLYRLLDRKEAAKAKYQSANNLLSNVTLESIPNRIRFAIELELINSKIGIALLGERVDLRDDSTWLYQQLTRGHDILTETEELQAANVYARLALAVVRDSTHSEEDKLPLLEEAARFGEELVQRRGEPRDHQLLQTVRDELAVLLRQAGRYKLASAVWLAEIDRLEGQVDSKPNRPDLLQSLAFSRMEYAKLQGELLHNDLAKKSYLQAIQDLNRAWQQTDADAYYHRNVAASHAKLGRSLDNDDSATKHLDQAIAKLRAAVAVEGPSANDLIRLAECYEALGQIAHRGGKSIAIEHFDSAEKCFQVLADHQALDRPLLNQRARNLRKRASEQITVREFESAQKDLNRANALVGLSLGKSYPAGDQSTHVTKLLRAELLFVEAELSQAMGNVEAAANSDSIAIDHLHGLAAAEARRGESDIYPWAIQRLFDHLIESSESGPKEVEVAETWLHQIAQLSPYAKKSFLWHQRNALLAYVKGDHSAAEEAIHSALARRPNDPLCTVLQIHLQGGHQSDSEIASLAQKFPGDKRLEFWVKHFLNR